MTSMRYFIALSFPLSDVTPCASNSSRTISTECTKRDRMPQRCGIRSLSAVLSVRLDEEPRVRRQRQERGEVVPQRNLTEDLGGVLESVVLGP